MLTLRAGDSVLTVAPEQGGAVMGWSRGGAALLQPVRGLGCFPLVPYANRIAFGRFGWEANAYRLPLNFGDHSHSIHGVGWQAPWAVAGMDGDSVRLTLAHDGSGGWPFAFEDVRRGPERRLPSHRLGQPRCEPLRCPDGVQAGV